MRRHIPDLTSFDTKAIIDSPRSGWYPTTNEDYEI